MHEWVLFQKITEACYLNSENISCRNSVKNDWDLRLVHSTLFHSLRSYIMIPVQQSEGAKRIPSLLWMQVNTRQGFEMYVIYFGSPLAFFSPLLQLLISFVLGAQRRH